MFTRFQWKRCLAAAAPTGLVAKKFVRNEEAAKPKEVQKLKEPGVSDLSQEEVNQKWDFSGAFGQWTRSWDDDWDHRAPFPGQDIKKHKPKIRHIYLIRHGQYELDDKAHGLTDLGMER